MKHYEPNFKRLDELTKEGFLRKVVSPCKKLMLYNYTDKCTYEKKWNQHTLNARGTVYEIATGKVVAKAFPNFFNFGELASSKGRNLLKKDKFQVYEKIDGSLGIVYFYNGEWRVNTRGSFTSDQAIKATKMLKEKYNMENFPKDITILVEIIYPENRIIVDYGGEEKLVVIGGYDLQYNGLDLMDEENSYSFRIYLKNTDLEIAPIYHQYKSIQEVIDKQIKLEKMEEGFVVRFASGERVKFKSAEYLKVAKLLSNLTPLNFWKAMENGKVRQDILEEIPEEFENEVNRIKDALEKKYLRVAEDIYFEFDDAMKSIGSQIKGEDNRKKLGLHLKKNKSNYKYVDALFPMLLDKKIDKYIMKAIRPKGNEV